MPPSAMYHVLFSRLCNLTVSPCFRSSAKAASRSGINVAMPSARTLSTMLVWPRYENKHCAKSHTGRAGPGAHDKQAQYVKSRLERTRKLYRKRTDLLSLQMFVILIMAWLMVQARGCPDFCGY